MLFMPWAQPASTFATWKARGCNALFGAANDLPKAKWEQAAHDAGMDFITAPGTNPAWEAQAVHRIGFLQPDEPDLVTHIARPGSAIDDLKATYAACVAANGTANRQVPVYMNLAGPAFDNVAYDGTPHPAKTDASKWGHRAATGGYMAWADVIGFDYYLWTNGRPGRFDIITRLMDRAWEWSGHKPIFAYVETCTQGKGVPFTADNYEAQVNTIVDYAKLKGYTLAGLVYFATDPTGKSGWPAGFDVTPPDVAERMKVVHARLNPPPPPAPSPLEQLVAEQAVKIADLTKAMAQTTADLAAGLRKLADNLSPQSPEAVKQ